MKAYAMLLGMMLTLGSGYAAQVAVSSVGTARPGEVTPTPVGRTSHGPDTVWYGGVLDPITVEARGDAPASAATARRLLLDRPAVRCFRASRV
ncbi:MAG: hypothetical protein DMD52_02260 [Gemmatimonadetes bacterium]|nr:MAG: hypothetical protein DMD52_02260 [Gemmatimonadota bacterium]